MHFKSILSTLILVLSFSISIFAQNNQMHVEGNPNSTIPVFRAEPTYEGSSNIIAVQGYSLPSENTWGTGGYFIGGWYGLRAEVPTASTGSFSSYGLYVTNNAQEGATKYGTFTTTTGASNYGLYARNTTPLGYAGFFDGLLRIQNDRPTIEEANAFLNGINLRASGTSGNLSALVIHYSDLADEGVGLFGSDLGDGLNVGDPAGNIWYDVNASAFNISSDKRLKKDIQAITANNAQPFMQQIRAIESATYWYKTEDKSKRNVPHVGVIAQSLPLELQAEFSEKANGSTGEMRLGVSLGDWLGLVTVGVKENDRRVQVLEQTKNENTALAAKVTQLEAEIAQLKAQVAQVVAAQQK